MSIAHELHQKWISMKFNDLELSVVCWATERGIIPHATPVSQLLKAVSEMGELADAVGKLDHDATKDAVGDVLVCLINFCALKGTTLTECLEIAYNQIKDRKGVLLKSGVFVKQKEVQP